jgi:hypothetical protein
MFRVSGMETETGPCTKWFSEMLWRQIAAAYRLPTSLLLAAPEHHEVAGMMVFLEDLSRHGLGSAAIQ